MDSCKEVVTDAVFKHLADEKVAEKIGKKMDKLIKWVKKEFPNLTDEKFHEDVKDFVQAVPKVVAKLDPGKVCEIVTRFAAAEVAKEAKKIDFSDSVQF